MTEAHVEPAPVQSVPLAVSGEEHTRIRWGAVIGGAVAALGIWALLYSFGLAIGLSSIDPNEENVRGAGIFTGIWSIISPLIALFVGGFVASRGADAITKGSGAMHGLVMWGLTTLVGAWAVANLVSMVVGGAVSFGRAAVSGVGEAAGKVTEAFNLDANDALAPINEKLRAEGRPEIEPGQLQEATKDVLSQAVKQGRLDRDTLVSSITGNTGLSRADADQVASRVEQQFDRAKTQIGVGARKAADVTGKAFWGVFGALLFGLLASLAGGVLGASPRMHERALRARSRAFERVPATVRTGA